MRSSTVEYKLRVKRFTHAIDNDDVVLEEWCIFRRFTDFSALHKQLRSQVGEQAVGNNIAQKLRDSIDRPLGHSLFRRYYHQNQ